VTRLRTGPTDSGCSASKTLYTSGCLATIFAAVDSGGVGDQIVCQGKRRSKQRNPLTRFHLDWLSGNRKLLSYEDIFRLSYQIPDRS
jgi:hypothetical protein